MHSVWKMLLFTVWSSSPDIVEISSRALIAKLTPIFLSWRGSSWTNPGLSTLQYQLFWEFTAPCQENHISSQKNMNCATYTHWRNQLQKCILATRECSFKEWTTDVLHSYNCNRFVTLYPDFSKHSSPEMRNFLQHFAASSYLKCGMFKIKTVFNNVWVEALHHWWEETHSPAINWMIHGTCLLLPTVTL